MTDGETAYELHEPVDRMAFLIAVDGKDARNGAAARHHGKALAFGNVAEKLREMLVGLTGADRSIHAFNLVDNTRLCKAGILEGTRLAPGRFRQTIFPDSTIG
jgi:hypothetical protein